MCTGPPSIPPAARFLLKQRAPVIVRARQQRQLRNFATQLHPRHLNVIDRSGEHDAGQRVNFQVFSQRPTIARQSLREQQRVLVNESQRHELGEAAGARLDLAEQ